MRKLLLFSLLLFVVHTTTKGEQLIVEMTTNKEVGSTISFQVSLANTGTTLNVDFGDGSKVPFTDKISISGTVAGNAIKIYGEPTDLVDFWCYGDGLATLDVSNNTALEALNCFNNNLSSLDVSNNTALERLDCDKNNLSSLDVSVNTALEALHCYNNNLSSLDVSNITALKKLGCGKNNLSSLDVSNNKALIWLSCNNNNLSFSSLPQEGLGLTTFTYAPQSDILINNIVQVNTSVDLSAEREVDGNTTTFVWKNESGDNLVEGTDYTIANGVTTFLKLQPQKVYCEMTNPLFPDLTLKTTLAEVSNTTGVDEFKEDGFNVFSANRTIIVDTSNNGLLSVVDMSGKVIVQKNINPGRTEIPVAKEGVYIVSLINQQKCSKKIIVK